VSTDSITVVIPSIPPRTAYLNRALSTVALQTVPVTAVAISYDHAHEGAGPNRTRALRMAQTEWVAFLDDDDELLPHHLETLLCCAREVEADVIWPWFQVIGGEDPIPGNRGKQWDPETPHTFPMTTLVRNKFAQLGHFPEPLSDVGCSGEDFNFWVQMSDLGARFQHVNEVTWWWHHDSGNTAGLPSRW
jgi:hypothetical protein